jgi:hypothetical protein
VLAGIGGVMSLLAPNPLFPDAVRFVHLAEVTSSNLVFGALVGWMLWREAAVQEAPLARVGT